MAGRMSGAAAGSEVVVGVDGSAGSYAAVSSASHESAMRGLPIKRCHVVAPTLMGSVEAPNDTITQAQEAAARRVLERALRIVDERMGEARLNVRVEIRYAAVVGTLVDASRDAHMIAVGAHGLDEFVTEVVDVGPRSLVVLRCSSALRRDNDVVRRHIAIG